MTHSTCYIEVMKDAAVERVPDFGVLRETLVPELKRPPGRGYYWLSDVSKWATSQGKPIRYIDNCWIEIELSAEELTRFLSDLYPDGTPEELRQHGNPSGRHRYVVVAEEF